MLSASQKQFGLSTGFDLLDCCAFRIIEYLQSCHNVVGDGSDLIFTTGGLFILGIPHRGSLLG
jgi:hypothetical protein